MVSKIDFNCDMGESFGMYKMGFDEEVINTFLLLISHVDSMQGILCGCGRQSN